ncbi:MAG: FAD-binding oxidoreductase [Pseudotabrizicola sp.]|uniref:NAD(P)/FAD-dependent oxidoreductase n=1 Tax=Pseudotabrizicola sp. TaxID=2939647 RepID=UPI002731FF39|nr:FAD-binding oxidoreductase [Pseudotabrizicola sp.]MDP2080850.1 FAD-binding oxidoreductase [Pseudotabrizicola sp.]MDZ7572748.1 FAD-binding oxidoreductase [Pseudotabrizicola sp.]
MNLLHANDRAGEFPPSYYAATATPLKPFPVLKGQLSADVCIVGGGYTGLSAALHLAEAGLRVVLLEAHRVGFGASGRNGGQVGSGQRQDQNWLEARVGREDARRLWDMGEDAKALVRDLIDRHALPVTFYPGIAHACRSAAEARHAHAYAEKLARDYGYTQIEPLSQGAMRDIVGSDVYHGGDLDHGAGHLHPLNYALGLAQAAAQAGAQLHERSEVHHIRHGAKPVVQTASGQVSCDHVILAGNGYLGGLDRKVASRVMPINNFILATEPLGDRAARILSRKIAVADTKFVVNYWRLSEDNRLLFGGGESYGYRFPDVVKTVMKPMLEVYPQLRDVRVDYAWGGTLAITMNRMPCFMRPAPNVMSASGYSGHGVAMATLAGKMMAQAVQGQASGFDLLARLPQQRFPGGAALRWPLLVAAMTWFSLRDRLGV